MDSEASKETAGSRRKVKFAPKAPPRRGPKPEVKTEVVEDTDAVQARDLLRRFNESSMKAKYKVEKKAGSINRKICGRSHQQNQLGYNIYIFFSASQIAFGYGGASTSVKSYGVPWGGSNSDSSQSSAFSAMREKEYKEPWDYYSYYPVTLPMRRPYSGNPELLDEEEFGEAAESLAYDENSSNPTMELGLLEENPEASLFLLQLPPTLPKQSTPTGIQDVSESSKPPGGAQSVEKPCNLDKLSSGFMGKLLVYRSGAIKMKLGDTLYDVSSGMNCGFAQDVVAINTTEKHCCAVGDICKHITITPDVDAILDSMADL